MRKWVLLLFLGMPGGLLFGQDDLPGDYYLQGVMETASGFRLNPDSTFEFFFSYGALDRSGKGRWTVKDGHLVLNSGTRPPKDFFLLSSKTVPVRDITVKIIENNKMLLRYVECVLRSPADSVMKVTDENGQAKFDRRDLASIQLLFQLCPDRPSLFPVTDKTHNYFEFRFEPWIAEVFFSDFVLQREGSMLKGRHPLLDGKVYSFVKEE